MSQQPLNLDAIEEQLARTLGLIETGNQSQLDQIDKLATAQSGKINGKLLTKSGQGSTWGGFFKNPTDNQREGFLNAGLALLGSSNNENLSQRIGQAIGAGVGAIREGREFDRQQGIDQQATKLKRLGIEQQGLKDQFGMQLQGANFVAGREDAAAASQRHIDTEAGKDRRANDAKNNINGVGNFQYTDNGETKSMPIIRTANGVFLPDANKTPLGDVLTPEQIASGTMNPTDGAQLREQKLLEYADELEAAGNVESAKDIRGIVHKAGNFAPARGGFRVTTNADGTTVIEENAGPNSGLANTDRRNTKISDQDALALGESRVKARQATRMIHQATQVETALLDGLNTGATQPMVRQLRAVYQDLADFIPGESEFTKRNAEELNRQELIIAIGNEWGARMLELFGGSDTEKELQIALTTQVGLGFDEETNFDRIRDKIIAAKVLSKRVDFETEWLAKNESLANPDKDTGASFEGAWMEWQLEQYQKGKRSLDLEKRHKGKTTDELIDLLNRKRL